MKALLAGRHRATIALLAALAVGAVSFAAWHGGIAGGDDDDSASSSANASDTANASANGVERPGSAALPAVYRPIAWDDLIPEGWNPLLPSSDATATLTDGDPRAGQMLAELRAAWDDAPTVDGLNGSDVRLPGYVVPLDVVDGRLKSFLLVPYFGACIHTPPPPANQIVHVVVKVPAEGFRTMDVVWASGRLTTARQDSVLGASGYSLEAVAIDHYLPPAR